jgi:hypothetical protein
MGCIPDDFKEDDPSLFGTFTGLLRYRIEPNTYSLQQCRENEIHDTYDQNSFDYFILFIPFIKQFFSEVYDLFHTSRLSSLDPYQPSTASRAHMEKIMY